MKNTRQIRPSFQANSLALSLTLGIAVSVASISQAHAFLVDNSNQKTIYIGNGQNLQAVQVNPIPAPAATTNVQVTQHPIQQQPTQTYATNAQAVQPVYNQAQYVPVEQYQQTQQAYQQYQQAQTQYQQPTYAQQPQYQQPTYAQPTYTQPTYTQPSTNYSDSYYGNALNQLDINTSSAAVMVFDMSTGQPLYQKNINATRSIASVTKMMTAMVVLDSGQDMRETLTISSNDLVGAKQASTRLRAGDQMDRSATMLMMLMKSENPAAKALATNYPGGFNAFIAAMNAKAQSLGMHSTRFADSSGLNPRNVSSASDLTIMMREIATNPRYQTIRNFSTTASHDFGIYNANSGGYRTYSAANTSRVVRAGSYPLGASKTGFIREAGYCVVMEAHLNGRPVTIVQLGAGSSDSRWSDANRILAHLSMR